MQNLMYRIDTGQLLADAKFTDKDDWRAKEARPAAEKRVKAGLVLAELSKFTGRRSFSRRTIHTN